MTYPTHSARARFLLTIPCALAAGASFVSFAQAATTVTALDELIVYSALRSPTAADKVTASVTSLDPQDLRDRGVFELETALNESPGVISTSTAGQNGAPGSLLIRGTTTAYSQVVIDGVRLSDSTVPIGNFLGIARIDDIGRLEVLRGAQSAFYGGEAVGGVVWMETARGEGDPSGRFRVEAGSFNTISTYVSEQGTVGALSFFVGGGYDHSDNDTPGEEWQQGRSALRAEWQVNKDNAVGITYRLNDSRYDSLTPAPVDPFAPASSPQVDHIDAQLFTAYANTRFNDIWTANTVFGVYDERYDNDGPYGNFGSDLQRLSLSTNHAVQVNERNRILAGASYENSDFANTYDVSESRDRYGAHLDWECTPIESLTTHAAVRWEDYAAYGDEVTWRAGAGYHVKATDTTIRGGIGRSFITPTYTDLFGSSWGPGNTNLKGESSIGWDLGVEQVIVKDHVVTLTYFENSIEDRIDRPFAPETPFNTDGATPTRGVELGAQGSFIDRQWRYRLAYTYLDESIQDQPHNVLTASLDWHPTDKLMFGAGVSYMDDRSWGFTPIAAYTLARIYGSYRINDHVSVNARVENLFNESYEQGNFSNSWDSDIVQGPGTGCYLGVTVDW